MKAVLAHRTRVSSSVVRQLFISTVASQIDYAASVCCHVRLDTTVAVEFEQPFEPVQRVTSQAMWAGSQCSPRHGRRREGIETTVVRLRARILSSDHLPYFAKGPPSGLAVP